MNWTKPRCILNLSVPKNKFPKKVIKKNWSKKRLNILKKYNYTCRFCGGKYYKYLIGIHIDNDRTNCNENNLDICCPICHTIINLKGDNNGAIILKYSKLSQLDIVRKTVDYIIKNNSVPKLTDIDPFVKNIDLSVLEYSFVLKNNKNIDNLKIFFTDRLNTIFIPTESYAFIEENSDSLSFSDEINISTYYFSNKEKKLLKECFYNYNNNNNNNNNNIISDNIYDIETEYDNIL